MFDERYNIFNLEMNLIVYKRNQINSPNYNIKNHEIIFQETG